MIDNNTSPNGSLPQSMLCRLETQLMFVVLAASYRLHHVRLRLRGYSRQAAGHQPAGSLERMKRAAAPVASALELLA
jgi:hypothetical protein